MKETIVGYSGGQEPNPTYEKIKDHTESVLITFNPSDVSYEELVKKFFHSIDPGCAGRGQYRSFLAYLTPTQEEIAKTAKQIHSVKISPSPFKIPLEPATSFYKA